MIAKNKSSNHFLFEPNGTSFSHQSLLSLFLFLALLIFCVGYEPLARSHYRSRREAILTRLEALQNSDASSGCTGGKLYPEPLSVGFCASLKRLYPTLKRLLEEL
eukprot:TRINITY_DN6798_c0_g1_i3.p1 TRINITY_DN6798_c0_g1~~TRINITY_DN6798_c0_g1_i3.p1  ORF type:complete len:105 (+),score=16.21 TRINITY_DN6798_c0_g1_i3:117-431(+)